MLNVAAWSITIVAHTDLDGVAASAAYLRLAGAQLGREARLFFTEPYKLVKVLRQAATGTRRLVVVDLGLNARDLGAVSRLVREAVRQGVKVEWYDHHIWDREWIEGLTRAGATLHIDNTTCAAGVVLRYAPQHLGTEPDDTLKQLIDAACAADLWRWDHPLAPKLFRVVDRYHGRRGDKWRRELVRGFSSGALWWPELDEALQEYIRREFEGASYSLHHTVVVEVKGCKIVFALKKPGPPNASIVAAMVTARTGADVAVIVKVKGRGLSLRSRRVNVREIAVRMGGGGHVRASGAPLRINPLLAPLSRLIPRIRLRYAIRQVVKAVEELGGCPQLP